jgi:predicted PurR-regulated permease PerM
LNIDVPRQVLPSDPSTVRRIARLRADIKIIRGCVLVLVVLAILSASVAGADLLAPTAIAATLALVLAPVARTLEKLGFPSGLAAVVTVVATVSCLTAGAFALAPEISNWLNEAPKVAQSIERKLRPITRQIAVVESVSNRLAEAANPTPGASVRSVTVSDGFIVTAARTAPGVLEKSIYVTVLTIFLLACRRRYTIQLILLPRTLQNRLRMARICRDVRSRVSGYLFTLSLINIGLAAITALCFSVAGIGDALLWGIAFGVLNFIPIIGPTTVIVVAAVLGFATANTIAQALAPPLILLALNTVEANLVQPWLLSRRIVISPVAIFLTVVTLVWMWGPAAAITAVSILISFHTVALHVPTLRPVAFLLASEGGALAMRHNSPLTREPRRLWQRRPRSTSS